MRKIEYGKGEILIPETEKTGLIRYILNYLKTFHEYPCVSTCILINWWSGNKLLFKILDDRIRQATLLLITYFFSFQTKLKKNPENSLLYRATNVNYEK